MSVGLQAGQRPPFVVFEARAVEDRKETIAKGRLVNKEVDWVTIRQAGSKDTCDMEAAVWLEGLHKDPNMLPEWVDRFKAMYGQWKAGQEPTPDGTHVTQWPAINKGQASLLISANLLTVEDVAAANESALARVGIGARDLQNKARDFLKAAEGPGKLSEEMAASRAEMDGLKATNARQAEEIKRLANLVEGLTSKMANQGVDRALDMAPPVPAKALSDNDFM